MCNDIYRVAVYDLGTLKFVESGAVMNSGNLESIVREKLGLATEKTPGAFGKPDRTGEKPFGAKDKPKQKGSEELYHTVKFLTPKPHDFNDPDAFQFKSVRELLEKNFFWARTIKYPYLSCKAVMISDR